MRIVFSDHALHQIQERNLSKSQISRVVENPQILTNQSRNRFRAMGIISRKQKRYVLIVVYDIVGNGKKEIVTAFVSSKIKKYL